MAAAAGSEIISQDDAARHGLTRSWWTQVQMDGSRSRLQHLVLYEGVLYAQTDRAMVHAIDAETGATLWDKQIGRSEHPSMTPGLSRDLLAVINGSRLYLANRLNGEILFERDIDGAPGAGPAVSDERVYVPTVTGRLLAYAVKPITPAQETAGTKEALPGKEAGAEKSGETRKDIRLSQKTPPPLFCQSKGRILVQPLVTRQNADEEYVVWTTDQGYMYIARIDRRAEYRLEIKFRLETSAPFTARPSYLPPDPKIAGDSGVIFAASGDSFVYAILEKNGETLWQYSTGEPLYQPAVVIEPRIYAATAFGGLYAIDILKGGKIWYAPNVFQFVSASNTRVYCADKLGQILILDAARGVKLDTFPAPLPTIKLINSDTDRLYLATPTGLIQCLREIELTKPIYHGQERKQAALEAVKTPPEQKPKAETDTDAQQPAEQAEPKSP
jgi:outer membrane protein assembly factor BamB